MSAKDFHGRFVIRPTSHRSEVARPDAIVALLEADLMLFQRVGDREQLVFEADRPGVRHPLGEKVARILERRRGGVRDRRTQSLTTVLRTARGRVLLEALHHNAIR